MRTPILTFASLLALASGCSSHSYAPAREVEPVQMGLVEESSGSRGSLFLEDELVMSDEDIARALDAQVALPDEPHMVLYRHGSAGWYGGGQSDQALAESWFGPLAKRSPKVGKVTILPGLLTPQTPTIPHLRVAAARCQAELLFIYSVVTDADYRRNVFSADESRVRCSVEGVLVHIRSGLVVFATVASGSSEELRTEGEWRSTETMQRARTAALGAAMKQVSAELESFLNPQP